MQYSKFQRFTSFFILFFFFFSSTIHFPINDGSVFADNKGYKNIVSIIVNEDMYPLLRGSLSTYANNISNQLENTKVIIFPTPKSATAYEIASLNESLYFEGLRSIDNSLENGKLIGTVLVGDLNLPIAHENTDAQKTVVPYVDFEDKYFVFNHESGQYEKNENNIHGLGVEIWHGIISPNLGSDTNNITAIQKYFSKNNDYYNGEGLFKDEKGILNGNLNSGIPTDYEPFVFYFDQIRETQAINLESYNAYEAYLENKEDILYKRYSKDLAEKIKDKVLGSQDKAMEGLQSILGEGVDLSSVSGGPDLLNVPDIQLRHIVNKSTKKFAEIFSKGSIGELRKNVHNAGRYNLSGNKVNVDFIPYIITILDGVNDEILKEAGDDIEKEINRKVEFSLQDDVYLPYRVEVGGRKYGENYTDVYVNLLSGSSPKSYSSAIDCSPFRGSEFGSGVVTLGSRGLVVGNIESDMAYIEAIDMSMESSSKVCLQNINNGYTSQSVFGGETPLNLDQSQTSQGAMSLNNSNLDAALLPVFDIAGAHTQAGFSASSYRQCLDNNFFAFTLYDVRREDSPHVKYQLPALGIFPGKNDWNCTIPAIKRNFIQTYESLNNRGKCSGLICVDGTEKYFFKKISSVIKHNEPSIYTITEQIKSGITPNIPIDDDRYIDFKDLSGNYKKINYPYLFRLSPPEGIDLNYENIDNYLKKYFQDNKQDFGDINFYEFLKNKGSKDLIIGDDIKTLTYLDSVIFSIYWNNLNSVSAKYKFVFENYLNDQFINADNKFNIPKNKKQYEIAYLGAYGDSENMYIQMNPESKGDNPYADIVQKNASLQSKLLGQNIGNSNSDANKDANSAVFKCAPPEGVPIFEWIPAIVCWLDDMLPPTITVNESTCGPTLPLLSNEDKEYLEQCNGDTDKNGINDCLENKLKGGSINSYSDSNKYYYNKPGILKAELLDSQGNILSFDNHTKVTFKLLKIEGPKNIDKLFNDSNKKILYSLGDDDSLVKKYINFIERPVGVKSGIAKMQFSTKTLDVNYIFQASLEVINSSGKNEISLIGDEIKVEVRGDRLFSTTYNLIDNIDTGKIEAKIGNSTVIANTISQIFMIDKNQQSINDIKKQIYSKNDNPNKLVISLENISKGGNQLEVSYPLTIKLYDKNSQLLESSTINKNQLKNFYEFFGLTKSGNLTLEIIDADGYKVKKEIEVLASIPNKLDLAMGATVLESDGAVISNVITILDKYDNVVIGSNNTLDINIDGNNIVFENDNSNKSSSQVIEGYKIFRLKSTENKGKSKINFELKNFSGKTILSKIQEIQVINEIQLELVENSSIKVGGDTYNLKINIVDENNSIYSDINSRLYFSINDIYGKTTQAYFPVINGVANVELITTILAASDVPIEIQVEGLKSIYNNNIKINHDVPAYIQLGMDKYAIEANEGNTSKIEVFVKDQYGNVTYDEKGGNVVIEILPEYEKYTPSNGVSAIINNGSANVIVEATDQPGMAYFKANYNGLEAIGQLNTYYYWNKKALEKTTYNSLYTTLLGAPYGDITKENYLAGALLFNDNRSITVTSLLNSPYSHNDVVMIDAFGGINSVANKSDLSTDIDFGVNIENNKLGVSIKNVALGDYIGKIQPVLGGNTQLKSCKNTDGDINNCIENLELDETTIFLSTGNSDYQVLTANDSLYLQNDTGRKIFSIDSNGIVERNGKVYFELEKNKKDNLQIGIFISGQKIGTILYSFVGAEIKTTRNSELFEQKIKSVSNQILILLGGGNYVVRDVYDNGHTNKVIYFNSPFDTEHRLNDFSKGNMSAYENFAEKGGIGWTEGNKSLLQFSAGASVGESVKSYQSFGVVTLGDPVLSLKKIQKDLPKKPGILRTFDPTIGKLISNKSTVDSYNIFDYNNDNKEDLLLIHRDNYLELLENTTNEKGFSSRGNIAQIYDLGPSEGVKGGDFTGDGYEDIFFINNQGLPFILNNNKKDFVRFDISKQISGLNKIIRSEVYDMDNDGSDDIIILDERGGISILFGSGVANKPEFILKKVGSADMPELNGSARTDRGALYFEGLTTEKQAGDFSELISESEAFQNAIHDNVENLADYDGNGVNTTALESLIYVKIPYKYSEIPNGTQAELLVEGINTPVSDETGNGIIESQNSLSNLLANTNNDYGYPESYPELAESSFIKSKYVEILDIEVSKTYNGELVGGSTIDFNLLIKNNSTKTLNNISYVENIVTIFTLDQLTLTTSIPAQVRYDIPGYDFMVDDFSLAPGESLSLSAKLKTAPIKYGHIQVGLFEKGEVGDDSFGDIFYSVSHESCGETKTLFRSCGVDSNNNNIDDCNETIIKPGYVRGIKTPKCNESNIGLPEEVSKNVEDLNQNGIPDYIDDLTGGSISDQQKYAETALGKINIDSDNDGIPDSEDSSDSSKDFLSNLEDIEENIDHVLAGVDNLIQGFSCGFGGGGCIATPLNWAPLAPGGDPTLFGVPIGDGLNIDEGIPIFSALTWFQYGPICGPAVWPPSPLSEGCSNTGAGGYLGIDSPSNFFRLFATPTLTGGFGVAACFGGPARVAGYSNMPGLHPLLPGGNCIVTAMPLASCSNDGSDGDPGSVGFPVAGSISGGVSGKGFGIFNANCSGTKNKNTDLDLDLVQEYLDYKSTGVKSQSFEDKFKESFTKISHPDSSNIGSRLNEPLVQINGQGLDDELSLNIDFGAVKSGDFSDIIQVQNRRISAFPDFLMGWVTRQIEEIVNKLTDFPTVFIILPDFSGVLDFGESKSKDMDDVVNADENITGLVGSGNLDTVNSGIKEAYTFLSNIPLVNFTQESLSVEIPWVDSAEIAATEMKWKGTIDKWKEELKRAQDAWSFGATCSEDNPKMTQKECEDANTAANKIILDVDILIGSMDKNLEIIQSYKNFPKELNKLVKKKEDYLEQILCNVESISEILGGWIGKNGERFKSWVELYILIKAILKSWQLLIDVFVDYEAECSECKNERGDLMTFIWKMISAVIPQIPVIQFPKWPDIIMDLHNIRAGLTISLPEFNFGTRPILLPDLPNLKLPDVPNLSINIQESLSIPILPTIVIPELPDLPGLPTVELPNLPPPPTLPKMFASLEGILEILKAITKAMCILKTSPFVPEWRAGDQIAFLTERQGYLPTDFIDLSMPQFSYPFVDAIKVTTFVNLEFETDFITELTRQITMPLTNFSSDFTQILNLGVDDFDFSNLPSNIDINIGTDGVESEISYSKQDLLTGLAVYVSQGIGQLVYYLDTQKDVTISNNDFKLLVAEALSSDVFVSHPKYNSFRSVWDEAFDYKFESENKLISDLQKNNFDKFETVKDILHTEILKNKEVEKNLMEYMKPSFIQTVSSNIISDVDSYNSRLDIYNQRFIESANNIITPSKDVMVTDLAERGEELLQSVSSPLTTYSNGKSQLAMTATSLGHVPSGNKCQVQSKSPYKYDYEGLYTIENVGGEDYSYRLFDYLDELTGKEEISNIDSDNDGDTDVIYMMNGQIFIKENLNISDSQLSREVETIDSDDNPFYNGDIFYSSIDNFKEGIIDNNIINAGFSSSSNQELFNYRMIYSRLVDKTTKKISIIDGVSNIEESTFEKENEIFIFGNNVAYINNIGKLKDIILKTKELIDIKKDLEEGNIIDISAGTKIYAGNQAFRLTYMIDGSTDKQIIVVSKNKYIELKSSIKIIGISGDAYIEGRYDITLRGEEIRKYKGLPLSLGSHIEYIGDINSIDTMAYIELVYYEGSEALLNFNFIEEYWLYDLGTKDERLTFSLNMDNDYLYATIQSFKNNIFSTYSNQILLSPQKEADNIAPELYISGIQIPVYQEKIIDIGGMIYEDGGLRGIQDIVIDMDLDSDTNGDGDTKNDRDILSDKINHNSQKLEITFGKYDYLDKTKIGITLVDENSNSSYSEIPFKIYSPTPQIETINELGLIGLIDENLDDEPVSLYRYRGGVVSKLNNNEGSHKAWTDEGDYQFKIDENNTGLTLEYGKTIVAEILENTGKIILKDFSSTIKVFASNSINNDSYYPKIEILKNGNSIYYQYLQVSEGKTIKLVDNFDNVSKNGMYMKFTDTQDYGYYQIPETVSYNPGAVVIYRLSDINKEALFIIFPDGKIETVNDYYGLEYNFENDNIILSLIDKYYSKEISKILFSIDGGYIMK